MKIEAPTSQPNPRIRLAILTTVFLVFVFYSFAIVSRDGVSGIAELFDGNPWKAQVFFDLCIMLSLFLGWMWKDARKNGIPPLPYFLLGAFTGSVGALAYLIHRTAKQARGKDIRTAHVLTPARRNSDQNNSTQHR